MKSSSSAKTFASSNDFSNTLAMSHYSYIQPFGTIEIPNGQSKRLRHKDSYQDIYNEKKHVVNFGVSLSSSARMSKSVDSINKHNPIPVNQSIENNNFKSSSLNRAGYREINKNNLAKSNSYQRPPPFSFFHELAIQNMTESQRLRASQNKFSLIKSNQKQNQLSKSALSSNGSFKSQSQRNSQSKSINKSKSKNKSLSSKNSRMSSKEKQSKCPEDIQNKATTNLNMIANSSHYASDKIQSKDDEIFYQKYTYVYDSSAKRNVNNHIEQFPNNHDHMHVSTGRDKGKMIRQMKKKKVTIEKMPNIKMTDVYREEKKQRDEYEANKRKIDEIALKEEIIKHNSNKISMYKKSFQSRSNSSNSKKRNVSNSNSKSQRKDNINRSLSKSQNLSKSLNKSQRQNSNQSRSLSKSQSKSPQKLLPVKSNMIKTLAKTTQIKPLKYSPQKSKESTTMRSNKLQNYSSSFSNRNLQQKPQSSSKSPKERNKNFNIIPITPNSNKETNDNHIEDNRHEDTGHFLSLSHQPQLFRNNKNDYLDSNNNKQINNINNKNNTGLTSVIMESTNLNTKEPNTAYKLNNIEESEAISNRITPLKGKNNLQATTVQESNKVQNNELNKIEEKFPLSYSQIKSNSPLQKNNKDVSNKLLNLKTSFNISSSEDDMNNVNNNQNRNNLQQSQPKPLRQYNQSNLDELKLMSEIKPNVYEKKILDWFERIPKDTSNSPLTKQQEKQLKADDFALKANLIKDKMLNYLDHHKEILNLQEQQRFYNSDYNNKNLKSQRDQVPLFLNKSNTILAPMINRLSLDYDPFYMSKKDEETNVNPLLMIPSHYTCNSSNINKKPLTINTIGNAFFNKPSLRRSESFLCSNRKPLFSHRANQSTKETESIMPSNPFDSVVKAREFFFFD